VTTYDPWADEPADPGARARRWVRVAAFLSLVAVVAGAVYGMTGPTDEVTGRWYVAVAIVGLGLVTALGCVWHGRRNDHERGRVPAVVAIALALPALGLVGSIARRIL
jgi:cytochrome bd-type quinol oxidase subunit 2